MTEDLLYKCFARKTERDREKKDREKGTKRREGPQTIKEIKEIRDG